MNMELQTLIVSFTDLDYANDLALLSELLHILTLE